MATTKPSTAQARALSAQPGLGVECNDIVEAPAEQIQALATAGLVDPHPDALSHARLQRARVVKIGDLDGALEIARAATEATEAANDLPSGEPA